MTSFAPMTTQQLKRMGFDRSFKQRGGNLRVRCSQCEALVIMGTPCHESGCPNAAAVKQQRNTVHN